MPPLTTETGKQFHNVDDLLNYCRSMQNQMMDPGMSIIESHHATIEFLYAFKALDAHLSLGGLLPRAWVPGR